MSQAGDKKLQKIDAEHYDTIIELADELAHWSYMKGAWRDSPNYPMYFQWAREAKDRLTKYLDDHSDI